MKTLVALFTISLCLLVSSSATAQNLQPNQKIENVWVKIKGQWDHNNNSLSLKKQILFSFEDTSEAKLKSALKKLPFLTTTAINNN
tara:strand:- start:320 stop:577 length:258 start_codon:yes stop_codon:yes gene_type:complete